MARLRLLWQLAEPPALGLIAFLAVAGAALSPAFLSPDFPATRLGGTGVFRRLAAAAPALFGPRAWSLAHGLGAALVAGLIWGGTALVGAGMSAVEPGKTRAVGPPAPGAPGPLAHTQLLHLGLGLQAAAFALVLVDGNQAALLLALVAAGLANACGLLPRRVRQSGPAAHLMAAGGILCAMLGGMLSQTGPTQVGFFSAVALGLLGAAMSIVRDFADIPGDQAAGLRTLPVMLGRRPAALVAMAAAVGTWLLTILLLLHRVGMQEGLYAFLVLLLSAHLFVLSQLMQNPTLSYARRAPALSVAIFMGVTALYVAAQALY
jgi:4-hydroxybenzoate polyprenyltransferase